MRLVLNTFAWMFQIPVGVLRLNRLTRKDNTEGEGDIAQDDDRHHGVDGSAEMSRCGSWPHTKTPVFNGLAPEKLGLRPSHCVVGLTWQGWKLLSRS